MIKLPSMKFYRNVGIGIFLVAPITLIAYELKMLDIKNMIYINIFVTFVEMILTIIILIKMFGIRKTADGISTNITSHISSQVLISKAKLFDKYIKSNNNVFDKNIIPTNPMRDSIFRIGIELAEKFIGPSLELSVIRMCDAGTCEQKIDASKCSIKGSHLVQINVDPREKVNFRFNKDLKIKSIVVDELYIS